MRPHPYLRAYMAGVTVPTAVLLAAIAIYAYFRFYFEVPNQFVIPLPGPPLERAIVFPMAVVPNTWGAWNMLHLALRSRVPLSLGVHGALLPLILIPSGIALARAAGRVHHSAAVRAADVSGRDDGLLPGVEVSRRIPQRGSRDRVTAAAGSRQSGSSQLSCAERRLADSAVRLPAYATAGCRLPAAGSLVQARQIEQHRRQGRVVVLALALGHHRVDQLLDDDAHGSGRVVFGRAPRRRCDSPSRRAPCGSRACSCSSGCARRGLRARGWRQSRRAAPRAPWRDRCRPCAPA